MTNNLKKLSERNTIITLILLFILSVLILLAILPYAVTLSQTPQQYIEDCDIVLLIDNSGSMRNNDNNNWRLKAANIIITYAHQEDRVSVILFNDNVINLNEQLNLPQLADLTEDTKNLLRKEIEEIRPSGYTDIIFALGKAEEILRRRSSTDRQPLIFLLTDGVMELQENTMRGRYGKYPISDWEPFLEPLFVQFKNYNWSVNSIGLRKGHSDFLFKISHDTRGGYKNIQDARDITDFYLSQYQAATHEIIQPFTGREAIFSIERDDRFKEITFALLTENGRSRIDSITCNERRITQGIIDSETRWSLPAEGQFIIRRINNPDAGNWRLVSGGSGLSSPWIAVRTNIILKVFPPEKEVAVGEEAPIKVAFIDEDGNIINDQDFFNRIEEVRAIITYVDAPEIQKELRLDGPDSEGYYNKGFRPNRDGKYTIDVKIKFHRGEQSSQTRTILVKKYSLNLVKDSVQINLSPSQREISIPFRIKAILKQAGVIFESISIKGRPSALSQNGREIIPSGQIDVPLMTVSTPDEHEGRIKITNIPLSFSGKCQGEIEFIAEHATPAKLSLILRRERLLSLQLNVSKNQIVLNEPVEITAKFSEPVSEPLTVPLEIYNPDEELISTPEMKSIDNQTHSYTFSNANKVNKWKFQIRESPRYEIKDGSKEINVRYPSFSLEYPKIKRLPKGESITISVIISSDELYREKQVTVTFESEDPERLQIQPSRHRITLTPDNSHKVKETITIALTALKRLPLFRGIGVRHEISDPEQGEGLSVKGVLGWYHKLGIGIIIVLIFGVLWSTVLKPKFDEDASLVLLSPMGAEMVSYELLDLQKKNFWKRSVTIGSFTNDIDIEQEGKIAILKPRFGNVCYIKPRKNKEIKVDGEEIDRTTQLTINSVIEIGDKKLKYKEI